MSTHCQLPSFGVLYGTRGTPIGIIRVTCRRGPSLLLPLLATTPCVRRRNSSVLLTADDDGSRAAQEAGVGCATQLRFDQHRWMLINTPQCWQEASKRAGW